jgi:adenylate kinase
VAPPEINDEMDVFRVGTMLELVRELSLRVALVMEKRVKVCIQGPLGEGFFTGVPLMLSGMMKVLRGMDWQSRAGEQYEGILVQELVDPRTGKVYYEGNKEGRVAFGDVSVNAVDDEDEVFIIIAPQSMTGLSSSPSSVFKYHHHNHHHHHFGK